LDENKAILYKNCPRYAFPRTAINSETAFSEKIIIDSTGILLYNTL